MWKINANREGIAYLPVNVERGVADFFKMAKTICFQIIQYTFLMFMWTLFNFRFDLSFES